MAYIGNTPADKYQTLEKQSFSVSATTGYTLSYSVSSPQDISLYINNVRQNPNSSYTVSNTALTLSSATSSSDVMYAVFLGKSVGTIAPASNSVTTSMMASGVLPTNTPAFEAHLSGNQTVSNDTTTKVQLNTEVIDSDGCYDNSTNYRFTPTTAGNYHVFGRVRGQSATENDIKSVSAFIYKNGSAIFQGNQSNYNEATQHDIDVTVDLIVNLNGSGDYLELFGNVFGTSGAFRFALRDTRFGAYKLIGV